MAAPRIDAIDRAHLIAYFQNTWRLYEWLFSGIRDEATYFLSPDPLRNPLIFYWGHTAAFYVNKLRMAGLLQSGIDPVYDKMFAVGVDPADAHELQSQPRYPSLSVATAYRAEVYARVMEVLERHPFRSQILPTDPEWAILMGLEHDRIHFETSSVLLRQLPIELVQRPDGWQYAPQDAPKTEMEWIPVAGGKVSLGRKDAVQRFGWDNEFGTHTTHVGPYLAASRTVTNAEFRAFVATGGYEERAWWSDEGWQWRQKHGVTHPRFWVPTGKGYRYRAMWDEMPMPEQWPVEVTCLEAEAYCRWAGDGVRLLQEAEWRILADDAIAAHDPHLIDGHYNLHVHYGSPWAAATAPVQGSLGLTDVLGNVWCWVSDDFYPFEGFEPHPYYEDFSSPYFDADHGMMCGGSWASTGQSGSPNYRLWFRREFMQHAGFRLAKSV